MCVCIYIYIYIIPVCANPPSLRTLASQPFGGNRSPIWCFYPSISLSLSIYIYIYMYTHHIIIYIHTYIHPTPDLALRKNICPRAPLLRTVPDPHTKMCVCALTFCFFLCAWPACERQWWLYGCMLHCVRYLSDCMLHYVWLCVTLCTVFWLIVTCMVLLLVCVYFCVLCVRFVSLFGCFSQTLTSIWHKHGPFSHTYYSQEEYYFTNTGNCYY